MTSFITRCRKGIRGLDGRNKRRVNDRAHQICKTQGHCQRAHSLRGDRNDAVWYTAAPLATTTTDHHSIFLERTPRSRLFLNSFSSAFKVDCISLRVSAFFLALAPTGKAAKRRLLASRNFSCNFFSHAARSTILLRDHLHHRWIIRAA